MFKNRKRNRMAGYDYSQNALYFITFCVKDRICCFGKVVNGQMECNEYGKIAHLQWQWLFSQYPYIVSHAFVVMPNHVHGVIESDASRVGTGRDLSVRDLSLQPNPRPQKHPQQRPQIPIIIAWQLFRFLDRGQIRTA